MKNSDFSPFRALPAIFTLIISLIAAPAFSQNSGAVRLSYNYPDGTPVKYVSGSTVIQIMDINGQAMEVDVKSILGCTVKSAGAANGTQSLEITIDTLAQTTDSPGGTAGGPVRDALGKSFKMAINQQGRETDLAEAEKLVYATDDGGSSNAAQSFNDFFPDVPADPILPGYTWAGTDTMNSKSSTASMQVIVTAENKYEGIEEINGIRCAKISFSLSGQRDIKTQAQGMDIKITGPFTGAGAFYFSLDRGYFVRNELKTKGTGQVEITSPEAMSFPMVMEQTTVVEVK